METASGPIYEVTYNVEREIVDAFDSWLAQRVEESMAAPGVVGVEVYRQEVADGGRAKRVIHVFLRGDTELEEFLASHCADAAEEFVEGLHTTKRTLRHADDLDGDLAAPEQCLNCSTVLNGQYCGKCGQRATSRLISVWELLRDAFGDLFELDSRLWRTLIPLLVRPGRLTRDYLEGRRARFMPPFRMYLVLSIVFFLVAFFDPREELGILFEPGGKPVAEESQGATEAAETSDEIVRELADEASNTVGDEDDNEFVLNFSSGEDDEENCDVDEIDTSDWPVWLSSRMTEERLKAACDRVIADDGRAFLQKLLDNVPAALFLLLPLMALVLKVLYPLSKRYYVEHLLFVLHYHAFVFLLLSLQVLVTRLGTLTRLPELLTDLTVLAGSLYMPVYLYKALRRVYGQGAMFTILKFLVLMFAYFGGLLIVFGMVALFAAFSI